MRPHSLAEDVAADKPLLDDQQVRAVVRYIAKLSSKVYALLRIDIGFSWYLLSKAGELLPGRPQQVRATYNVRYRLSRVPSFTASCKRPFVLAYAPLRTHTRSKLSGAHKLLLGDYGSNLGHC